MPVASPIIAVVDDDESFRKALLRLLRACGFGTAGFESGEAFLSAMPDAGFDAVLLDIRLPGLTGPEVHDALRAAYHSTPVILMTADTTPAIQEQSQADGFLYKPFTEALLLDTLKAAWADSERPFLPPS
jgi:FixJ family two-component response regulator